MVVEENDPPDKKGSAQVRGGCVDLRFLEQFRRVHSRRLGADTSHPLHKIVQY